MQKLNFVYPKFLTRIDHYLKINYPHIWRTRVHDFAWFSLILGNIAAIGLGMLGAGYESVPSESSISTMHSGLAVLLFFVGLFWAMRLLRFKMKFSNFKMISTTWVIYALCIASLGLNLAVFTSSVAYRTASLYSSEILEGHYNYLNNEILNREKDTYYFDGTEYHIAASYSDKPLTYSSKSVYFEGVLKEEYRTEMLRYILLLHGYRHIEAAKRIYRHDMNTVKDRINNLKEAHIFAQQPILGKNHDNYEKSSFYHDFLHVHWVAVMIVLFFLPTLLFLVSVFGGRNVLISVFSTILMAGLTAGIVDALGIANGSYEGERMVVAFAFVAFILMLTLIIGKQRLRSWNYIAGVFMLMLGGVFFAFFVLQVEYYSISDNVLSVVAMILPMSLLASLFSAWIIARQSNQPILR